MNSRLMLFVLYFAANILSQQPCSTETKTVIPQRIIAGDTVNLLVFNFSGSCEQPQQFFFKIDGPEATESHSLLFIGSQSGNPSQSQWYRFDVLNNDTLKTVFHTSAFSDSLYTLFYGADTNDLSSIAFVVFPGDPFRIAICNGSLPP